MKDKKHILIMTVCFAVIAVVVVLAVKLVISNEELQIDIGSDSKTIEIDLTGCDNHYKRIKTVGKAITSARQGDIIGKFQAIEDYLKLNIKTVSNGGNSKLKDPAWIYETGEANSLGVANCFKELCDEMGIECAIVSGKKNRVSEEAAVWSINIVFVDDEGYTIDVATDIINKDYSKFLLGKVSVDTKSKDNFENYTQKMAVDNWAITRSQMEQTVFKIIDAKKK